MCPPKLFRCSSAAPMAAKRRARSNPPSNDLFESLRRLLHTGKVSGRGLSDILRLIPDAGGVGSSRRQTIAQVNEARLQAHKSQAPTPVPNPMPHLTANVDGASGFALVARRLTLCFGSASLSLTTGCGLGGTLWSWVAQRSFGLRLCIACNT